MMQAGELFPRTVSAAARLAVTLLLVAMLAIGVATAAANWHLTDLKAYLAAADLLASGGNPFEVQLWERGLPYHYHYSPWFAALFVPALALPAGVVSVGWSLLLGAAAAVSLLPLVQQHGWRSTPLVLLMAFLYLNLVAEGNVQALLLAGLVWTLERRSGPVMIGIAASLKLVPILLTLVYIGRGEWRRALVAAAVTAVLLAPTLLFEIAPTAVETGGTGLFSTAPVLWGIGVVAALAITLLLARGRHAWLAASVATVLALPRLLIFDVSNLVTAFPDRAPVDRD